MRQGPFKIVYLIDSLEGPRAGTEMQLLELLRGLPRARFEPTLMVLRPTPFVAGPDTLPCPVRVLGVHRLSAPQSWLRMASFAAVLRRAGVRLVHIL
ncbi:MAG: glycosyltransferase, partial [Acidimicrobiia bacterium]